MLPKSSIIPRDFYQPYLDLVLEQDNFTKALEKNTRDWEKLLEDIPKDKRDHAYADGKWTIREVVQHVLDAERVFVYRALTYSRMDASALPGFDENSWAVHAGGAQRGWKALVEEMSLVRKSSLSFFDSLTDEQLAFEGQANGKPQNAYTLAWLVAGHAAHHIRILKERYL